MNKRNYKIVKMFINGATYKEVGKEFDFIWSSPPCQSHSSFRQNICGNTKTLSITHHTQSDKEILDDKIKSNFQLEV